MELQLKNIGMIKEANVNIDGLTVIAGENDTGKTTIAKKLYEENQTKENNIVLIDTPNSLDTFSFIKNATLLIHQQRLNIHLARYRVDLILQLSQDILEDFQDNSIYKNIEEIIGGRVFYDKSRDNIYYEKYSLKNQIFKMEDTSNGIKMFGFIQILLLNRTIKDNTILILDEPEVHLHPKWQLKYAKIIVELVRNGVKILVNSHSPYMIEALKVYSDNKRLENKTNFYLSQKNNGQTMSKIENVTLDLEPIFKKLADPYRKIEQELG